MVIGSYDVTHGTHIRMIEQCDDCCFSSCADLLRLICSFTLAVALMLICRQPRDNLDRNLMGHIYQPSFPFLYISSERICGPTCSPVSTFLASFTFPMLPAPIVFPRAHCPVWALMVVRRLLDPLLPGTCASLGAIKVPDGVTGVGPPLVPISELYRE